MRLTLRTIPLFCLTLLLSLTTIAAPKERLLVKYKVLNTVTDMATAEVTASAMTTAISSTSGVAMTGVRMLSQGTQIVELGEGVSVADAMQALASDDSVEHVEVDTMMTIQRVPNDSRYNEQWHYFETLGGINLPQAWDISTGSPLPGEDDVVVAVIDTGIRAHADLQGQILPGYDFISDLQVANDGNLRDSDATDPGDWVDAGECGFGSPSRDVSSSWHGTHVAGTIAAKTDNGTDIAGVSWGAKILPLRALGKCGGFTSDIIDAMRYAAGLPVSGVPNNPHPAKVINLSLGGGGTCGLNYQNAINEVVAAGVVVVVAAGNDSSNASNFSPASCSNILTVAATNREGGRANYSNFGSIVDIAAPGGETRFRRADGILSTLNLGQKQPAADTLAFYQGTSMATPHVAGVAALMFAAKPDLTPDTLMQTMRETARSFPNAASNPCDTSRCGSGIVDAGAALTTLTGGSPNPGGSTELQNNVPVTALSGGQEQYLQYTIEVPAGATNLVVDVSGGSGDADLFVRFGAPADRNTFDVNSVNIGNTDSAAVDTPQAGTYHIALYGFRAFSGVRLVARYQTQTGGGEDSLVNGVPMTDIQGDRGESLTYMLVVPAKASNLNVKLSGGVGDADLFLKYGRPATRQDFDAKSERFGNNDAVSVAAPQAGVYYITLYGFNSFSGATLVATFDEDSPKDDGGPFSGENDTVFAIPDNTPSGIVSPIEVPRQGPSGQVSVTVDITHTYRGDLRIDLIAPDGSVFNLRRPSGDSQDNINQTFEVNVDELDSAGTWQLKVVDTLQLDQGQLNRWSLSIP